MSKEERFQTVFNELKAILQPYEEYLQLQADEPENYSLNAAFSPQYKQEVFFGAAQVRKNYVSYYLMPVYMYPSLLEGISPDLKKRMQGKSCFNFTSVNEDTFAELAQLTLQGFDRFKQEGLV